MKSFGKIFFGGVALLLGCGMAMLTSEYRDWTFIQQVGGLTAGEAQKMENGTYRLPILCDVSGREITSKPTTANSGLIVRETGFSIHKNSIQIWIKTCLADGKHNAFAPDVLLKNIPSGTYQVQYRNRDGSTVNLRAIEIK